jgi:gluconolactonase
MNIHPYSPKVVEGELTVLADDLQFPEGPVALPDGSVLIVEIRRRTLTRVRPGGGKEIVAELGGGPNGAAIGPDGRCYVCNNGGFEFREIDGAWLPVFASKDYQGGWIEAVDLKTGKSEVLYRACGDIPLKGPNDLVFDGAGGFYFTDPGKLRKRERDRGAVFYAKADGTAIEQVVFPIDAPNGIGLSADDRTLYVADTHAARIWAYELEAPGQVRRHRGRLAWEQGRMLAGLPTHSLLDSLALDAAGNVCVADIPEGGITVVSPDGEVIERHPMPDTFVTNIAFGGPELRTAFITLSSAGKLVSKTWPRPGLPLHWLNRSSKP